MIYTALPSAALVLSLIPAFLAVPFTPQPRAPGDSLNFDLKIWAKSSDTTLSVIPTNYEQGKTDQNLTSTSNADYTAEGTEPDYKTPEGASEQYVIIGQMHFNEVPDEAGRSVYILRNEGVETGPSKEKGVHCVVTFVENPGVEELFWNLQNEPPLAFPESFVDPENFHLVCNGDGGVIE